MIPELKLEKSSSSFCSNLFHGGQNLNYTYLLKLSYPQDCVLYLFNCIPCRATINSAEIQLAILKCHKGRSESFLVYYLVSQEESLHLFLYKWCSWVISIMAGGDGVAADKNKLLPQ